MTNESVDVAFLRSLGDRIGVRLIVVVPLGRRARYFQLTPGPQDDPAVTLADVSQLEALGRHWLATVTDASPEHAEALELPDASVALTASRTSTGETSGVRRGRQGRQGQVGPGRA